MTATQTASTITFRTTACNRCGGAGRIEMYRHIAGGVCAKCSGSGKMLSPASATAHRAYQAALTARLGKIGSALAVGDRTEHGEITAFEPADGFTWAVYPGGGKVGINPRRLYILDDPHATEEIAREIAAKYTGAALAA